MSLTVAIKMENPMLNITGKELTEVIVVILYKSMVDLCECSSTSLKMQWLGELEF